MRLIEMANHAWDARVAFDPDAGIEPASAALALESFAGDSRSCSTSPPSPDQLSEPAVVALDGFAISHRRRGHLSWRVRRRTPTSTFNGPLESVVRLMSGRLRPERTPAGVEVTGNVTLDDLRQVFPGY